MMHDQQRFVSIARSVVVEHIQDETLIFDLHGEALVRELFSTGEITERSVSAELGLVEPEMAKSVLEIVTFLNVVYKVVKEILELLKRDKNAISKATVESRLKDSLISQGIEPEKAVRITAQCSQDLAQFIRENSASEPDVEERLNP